MDVENEAGGTNQALVKLFTVSVSDGTLNLDFVKVNKAVLVSAISVEQQGSAPERTLAESVVKTPARFEYLFQNHPNPFNPNTKIRYVLPEQVRISLTIYNLLGEHIRTLVDGVMPAGSHEVEWNGLDATGTAVPSGVYIYRLQIGREAFMKKMLIIR